MPGAEQHDVFSGRIERGPNGLHDALAFGVFADHRVVVAEHEVDRADRRCRVGRAIQQRYDRLLVRRGAMGAAKTQRPQTSHGVAELFRADLERQVSPIEIVVGDGLFDHVLRGISAHGTGQQGQQRLYGGTGHG